MPKSKLDEIPKIRRYGQGDPLHVAAQRVWIILTALAQARRLPDVTVKGHRMPPTITYGELADMVGRGYRAARTLTRELMIVGEYCKLNSLPCLNALVVTVEGDCGGGVLLSTGSTRAERRAIAKEDWFALGVPTTGTLRKLYSVVKDG